MVAFTLQAASTFSICNLLLTSDWDPALGLRVFSFLMNLNSWTDMFWITKYLLVFHYSCSCFPRSIAFTVARASLLKVMSVKRPHDPLSVLNWFLGNSLYLGTKDQCCTVSTPKLFLLFLALPKWLGFDNVPRKGSPFSCWILKSLVALSSFMPGNLFSSDASPQAAMGWAVWLGTETARLLPGRVQQFPVPHQLEILGKKDFF